MEPSTPRAPFLVNMQSAFSGLSDVYELHEMLAKTRTRSYLGRQATGAVAGLGAGRSGGLAL